MSQFTSVLFFNEEFRNSTEIVSFLSALAILVWFIEEETLACNLKSKDFFTYQK